MTGKNNLKKRKSLHAYILREARAKEEEMREKRERRQETRTMVNELVELGEKLMVSEEAQQKAKTFLANTDVKMEDDSSRKNRISKHITKKSKREKVAKQRRSKIIARLTAQGKMTD